MCCVAEGVELPLRHLETFSIHEPNDQQLVQLEDLVQLQHNAVATGALVAVNGEGALIDPGRTEDTHACASSIKFSSIRSCAWQLHLKPSLSPRRTWLNRSPCIPFSLSHKGGKRLEVTTGPILDWCLDLGSNPGVWIITNSAW